MATTEAQIRKAEEIRNSGLYSIASMDLFDMIEQMSLSEDLLLHLDYTNDILYRHLNELRDFAKERPGLVEYLKSIKEIDVKNNHGLEKENPEIIEFFSYSRKEKAIDRLIRYAKSSKEITSKNFYALHDTLLYGTSTEENERIRTNNTECVRKIVDGIQKIDYLPIDYKEIPKAADKITELYNIRLTSGAYNNVFVQPFLIHGLIGALQLFNDGNTRLGRVMQHALLWQIINERTEFEFDMPPIYVTRSYYPKRSEYRKNIASIVVKNNNDAWNQWFDFNLYCLENSIYTAQDNILTLKRKINNNRRYQP